MCFHCVTYCSHLAFRVNHATIRAWLALLHSLSVWFCGHSLLFISSSCLGVVMTTLPGPAKLAVKAAGPHMAAPSRAWSCSTLAAGDKHLDSLAQDLFV